MTYIEPHDPSPMVRITRRKLAGDRRWTLDLHPDGSIDVALPSPLETAMTSEETQTLLEQAAQMPMVISVILTRPDNEQVPA